MRRVSTGILIASCTFTISLAATLFWIEYRLQAVNKLEDPPCSRPPTYGSLVGPCSGSDFGPLADIPNLSYCELMSDPDPYDGKIIRVHARYGGNKHGDMFYDRNCPGPNMQTAVLFYPTLTHEIEQALEQARGPKNSLEPLDLVAVGRFKKVVPSNDSDFIEDTAPFHFEMMRVENASKARWRVD